MRRSSSNLVGNMVYCPQKVLRVSKEEMTKYTRINNTGKRVYILYHIELMEGRMVVVFCPLKM